MKFAQEFRKALQQEGRCTDTASAYSTRLYSLGNLRSERAQD